MYKLTNLSAKWPRERIVAVVVVIVIVNNRRTLKPQFTKNFTFDSFNHDLSDEFDWRHHDRRLLLLVVVIKQCRRRRTFITVDITSARRYIIVVVNTDCCTRCRLITYNILQHYRSRKRKFKN